MKEGERYEFAVPEGIVYVTVEAADMRERGHGRDKRTEVMPQLRVSTEPSPGVDGFVKIRGREYRIVETYQRVNGVEGADGKLHHWLMAGQYGEGFFNGNGKRLEWGAATTKQLGELAEGVLNRFEALFPAWAWESERLARVSQRNSAARQVKYAHEALEKEEQRLAKQDEILAAYEATRPDNL